MSSEKQIPSSLSLFQKVSFLTNGQCCVTEKKHFRRVWHSFSVFPILFRIWNLLKLTEKTWLSCCCSAAWRLVGRTRTFFDPSITFFVILLCFLFSCLFRCHTSFKSLCSCQWWSRCWDDFLCVSRLFSLWKCVALFFFGSSFVLSVWLAFLWLWHTHRRFRMKAQQLSKVGKRSTKGKLDKKKKRYKRGKFASHRILFLCKKRLLPEKRLEEEPWRLEWSSSSLSCVIYLVRRFLLPMDSLSLSCFSFSSLDSKIRTQRERAFRDRFLHVLRVCHVLSSFL